MTPSWWAAAPAATGRHRSRQTRHRVAIVDRKQMIGGVCINTGTIPSKTLREAVLYLTGMQQRELYGASYRATNKLRALDRFGGVA